MCILHTSGSTRAKWTRLWETSAVNKKRSGIFCACVLFFLTDFTDEAPDLHFVWLILLFLGQKTHKNTRNQTNAGHRNWVFRRTPSHAHTLTRTPSLHMHYPTCTSKDSSSVRFTARSALFREQTARLQEPARGKTTGGGLETWNQPVVEVTALTRGHATYMHACMHACHCVFLSLGVRESRTHFLN